jgi:hypothetical protein
MESPSASSRAYGRAHASSACAHALRAAAAGRDSLGVRLIMQFISEPSPILYANV